MLVYLLVSNISNGAYTNMPLTDLACRSLNSRSARPIAEGQSSALTARLKVLERGHLLTQRRDLALQKRRLGVRRHVTPRQTTLARAPDTAAAKIAQSCSAKRRGDGEQLSCIDIVAPSVVNDQPLPAKSITTSNS